MIWFFFFISTLWRHCQPFCHHPSSGVPSLRTSPLPHFLVPLPRVRGHKILGAQKLFLPGPHPDPDWQRLVSQPTVNEGAGRHCEWVCRWTWMKETASNDMTDEPAFTKLYWLLLPLEIIAKNEPFHAVRHAHSCTTTCSFTQSLQLVYCKNPLLWEILGFDSCLILGLCIWSDVWEPDSVRKGLIHQGTYSSSCWEFVIGFVGLKTTWRWISSKKGSLDEHLFFPKWMWGESACCLKTHAH